MASVIVGPSEFVAAWPGPGMASVIAGPWEFVAA